MSVCQNQSGIECRPIRYIVVFWSMDWFLHALYLAAYGDNF